MCPQKPADSQHKDDNQGLITLGMAADRGRKQHREPSGDESKKGATESLDNPGHEPKGEGDPGLRNRKVAASTAGARLGKPRVDVQFRANLHVVAMSARIAKQRLSTGRMPAFVAKLHDGFCR
jgi:hypothetical protein